LKGFEGTREDLLRRLAMPDMVAMYNAPRVRNLSRTYPDDTLGGLVSWFTTEYPKWSKLSDATRKDYLAAFEYLRPAFGIPLADITQPDLYEMRDRCANEKWPRFADKMISAISSMFTQAVRRGKMRLNPALGIEKGHRADPNANREWMPHEWQAIQHAPAHIKTPMMLARYVGYRGQTIAVLEWKSYQPDPVYGKCFRVVARKNDERPWIPAVAELQAYLDGLEIRSLTHIATQADGTPWENEVDMQTAVSHWLRGAERAGLVGSGTTLHGLRVTYAAEKKRNGASDSEVAAALGDKSDHMGKHYTRHVENEAKVIRAFKGNTK
jgi:hypothetical protein